MSERLIALVKAFRSGRSLILLVPKDVRRELKVTAGTRFLVKIDNKGRIIYEPVQ